MQDILDFEIGLIPRGVDLVNLNKEPLLFSSSNNFKHYLLSYTYIDLLSFTYNGLVNARKVVIAITPRKVIGQEKIKVCDNLHTKLYLCYKNTKLKHIYLGSQNCTGSVTHNLMLRVDTSLHKTLVRYFNYIWNESTDLPFSKRET